MEEVFLPIFSIEEYNALSTAMQIHVDVSRREHSDWEVRVPQFPEESEAFIKALRDQWGAGVIGKLSVHASEFQIPEAPPTGMLPPSGDSSSTKKASPNDAKSSSVDAQGSTTSSQKKEKTQPQTRETPPKSPVNNARRVVKNWKRHQNQVRQ